MRNIAHSLFRFLDSVYAKDMTEIILKANGNENYVIYLLKNQTSVIDCTQNILRRSEAAMTKPLNSWSNNLLS